MSLGMLFVFVCLLWWTGAASVSQSADGESLCASCAREAAALNASDPFSAEQLRKARIEYIKAQILQKLRISAPPQVTTKPVLPDLLLGGHLLGVHGSQDDRGENSENFSKDDFYGTTKEIVIFPDNTSTYNCYTKSETHPNSCFRFRLTRDVTIGSVANADLWVYRIGNQNNDSDTNNLTYTVLEVTPDPTNGESYTKRFVAFRDTSGASGWLRFQIGPAVRLWAQNDHMTHALEISCTGCQATMETPVAINDDQKPFIIVYTSSKSRQSRSKRTVNCTEGMNNCCKEKFEFSFIEIGWNEWILHPPKFDLNVCRGSCHMDISASRYHHTTVKQKYISNNVKTNITLQLCCSPSKMQPLSILYVDEYENVIESILPNMIVEACDCA